MAKVDGAVVGRCTRGSALVLRDGTSTMDAMSFDLNLLVTRAQSLDVGRRIDVGRRNRKDQNAREPTFHRVLTARRPPNAPRLTVLQARVDLNCDARGIGNQGRGAAEQHLADDALLGDPIAEDLNVPDP